jgi:hypothetical protein
MDVIHGPPGQLGVDHKIDLRYVESATRDVGRDEDANALGLERPQRRETAILGEE